MKTICTKRRLSAPVASRIMPARQRHDRERRESRRTPHACCAPGEAQALASPDYVAAQVVSGCPGFRFSQGEGSYISSLMHLNGV